MDEDKNSPDEQTASVGQKTTEPGVFSPGEPARAWTDTGKPTAQNNQPTENAKKDGNNDSLAFEASKLPDEGDDIAKTIAAAGEAEPKIKTESVKEITIEDTIVGETNVPAPLPVTQVTTQEKESTPEKTAEKREIQKAENIPPKLPESPSKVKSIRTYKSDVAERIKSGQTSIVGIAVAEEERRLSEELSGSPKSHKNLLFVYLSVIFLLLGIGITIVALIKKPAEESLTGGPSGTASLVFTEKEKIIPATNSSPESLAKAISDEVASANNKLDSMESIYVTEIINGNTVLVTAQRFFFFLDHRMPPSLLRSLSNDFSLGLHTFNGNHLFMVLKTGFYENAFAGMLGWEEHMARDLFPMFGIKKKDDSGIFLRPFEDKTIKNLDARVLRDDAGEITLFYVFKDRGTIIITDSENTLEEVAKRLSYSSSGAR